jgi:hypothetical protein
MTHITLSLKDESKITPEIAAWLRAAEQAIQKEVDRVERELLVFGHSCVLAASDHRPKSDVKRYVEWDNKPSWTGTRFHDR